MDQLDWTALHQKLSEYALQNKQLKRANLNMKRENKYLKRAISKLKEEAANNRKQHYKNGRRGSKYNG
jgi:predicted RNase H-like nuclease (RuvC/YqgF family)